MKILERIALDLHLQSLNEFSFNLFESRCKIASCEKQIYFIKPDDTLWYIGEELPKDTSFFPIQIPNIENAIEVSSGKNHWCCLTSDNILHYFNNNNGDSNYLIINANDMKSQSKVKIFACGPTYTVTFSEDNVLRILKDGDIFSEKGLDIQVFKIFCFENYFWLLCENGRLEQVFLQKIELRFSLVAEYSNVINIYSCDNDHSFVLDNGDWIQSTENNYDIDVNVRKLRGDVIDLFYKSDRVVLITSENNYLSIFSIHSISLGEQNWLKKQIVVKNIFSSLCSGFYFVLDDHNKVWIFGKELTRQGLKESEAYCLGCVPETLISISRPYIKAKSAKK